MARPNPFTNPQPFRRVRIGGRLIKAPLVAFAGMKIEDGWKVDKSKSYSGGVAKFTGTKLMENVVLTFKAVDIATFDDLYEIWNILAPALGQGGAVTATAATGQTKGVGQASAAQQASAQTAVASALANAKASGATPAETQQAVNAAAQGALGSSAPDGGNFGSPSPTTPADPDPGPRPPALPIENAICAFFGFFSGARKSIELKYDEESLAWELDVGFIQDGLDEPAGAGAMTPPSPNASGQGYGGGSSPTGNSGAASQAAGT